MGNGLRNMWQMFQREHIHEKTLSDSCKLAVADFGGITYQMRLAIPVDKDSDELARICQYPTSNIKDWPKERILETYDQIDSEEDFYKLTGAPRIR